jgi:hypothetical protein
MADVKGWGARFNFPENLKIEYDGYSGGVSNQIAVKMAEQYDDFIVSQIAMEARAEGISDLTVLNKRAILNAIKKQIPQKPCYRMEEDAEGWACPACHMGVTVDHGRIKDTFCSHCGQAIDLEEA